MAQLGATVSQRVVEEVSAVTGTEPLELPPLYDVLDPDELDAIIETMPEGEVTFAYAGTMVSVAHDESIVVTERSEPEPTPDAPVQTD